MIDFEAIQLESIIITAYITLWAICLILKMERVNVLLKSDMEERLKITKGYESLLEIRKAENNILKNKNRINEFKIRRLKCFDKSKLCKEDVVNIKKMIKDGAKNKDIAKKFGVSASLISRIKNNKVHRNVCKI